MSADRLKAENTGPENVVKYHQDNIFMTINPPSLDN
jgi:hypothetical protein